MEKKYIGEVINYKRDIENAAAFIEIFAGVGSGKNYFVNDLIMGRTEDDEYGNEYTLKPMNVLLVTSRRAKVDETLAELGMEVCRGVGKNGNVKLVDDDGWGIDPSEYCMYCRTIPTEWGDEVIYQQSTVCTNAFIEKYLQYVYRPCEEVTHLWKLYDLIVIDEAHSVIMDSTYQTAPFYIKELVNEYLRVRREKGDDIPCKHIILMTGSPDSLECVSNPKDAKVFDLFEMCKNVVPKNIFFITAEDAKKQVEEQVLKGEKIVYFTNHVMKPSEFCSDTNIDPKLVTVSFSDNERRSKLEKEDEDTYKQMVKTEKNLALKQVLPDDVMMFLTTSKNKEGINIKNKDIKHLYVESHNRSDIVQMAGRIREGVDNMYVIIDAQGYGIAESIYEAEFSRKEIAGFTKKTEEGIGAANNFFEDKCKEDKISGLYECRNSEKTVYSLENSHLSSVVDFIHQKFPYVRYSYFDNVFKYYGVRENGVKYQRDSEKAFKDAVKNNTLGEMFHAWFPCSNVHPYITPEEKASKYLEDILRDDPDKSFSEDEVNKMTQDLNKILGTSFSQRNRVLGKFSQYRCSRISGEPGRPSYNKFKFKNASGDRIQNSL